MSLSKRTATSLDPSQVSNVNLQATNANSFDAELLSSIKRPKYVDTTLHESTSVQKEDFSVPAPSPTNNGGDVRESISFQDIFAKSSPPNNIVSNWSNVVRIRPDSDTMAILTPYEAFHASELAKELTMSDKISDKSPPHPRYSKEREALEKSMPPIDSGRAKSLANHSNRPNPLEPQPLNPGDYTSLVTPSRHLVSPHLVDNVAQSDKPSQQDTTTSSTQLHHNQVVPAILPGTAPGTALGTSPETLQEDPAELRAKAQIKDVEMYYIQTLQSPCSFSQILRLAHSLSNTQVALSPIVHEAVASAIRTFSLAVSHPVASPSVVFGEPVSAVSQIIRAHHKQNYLRNLCEEYSTVFGLPVATSKSASDLIQLQRALSSAAPSNAPNTPTKQAQSPDLHIKPTAPPLDTYYTSIAGPPVNPPQFSSLRLTTSLVANENGISGSDPQYSRDTFDNVDGVDNFDSLDSPSPSALTNARLELAKGHVQVYNSFVSKRVTSREISETTKHNDRILQFNIMPLRNIIESETRLGYDAFIQLNLKRVQTHIGTYPLRGPSSDGATSTSTSTSTITTTTTNSTSTNAEENSMDDLVVPLHPVLNGDLKALESIPTRQLSDKTKVRSAEMLDLLILRERYYSIDPLFLSRHASIKCRMRAILLDWLSEVSNEFLLGRETFHLAIALIDRYLSISGRAFLYIQRQRIREGNLSPDAEDLIEDPLVPNPRTGELERFPSDTELDAMFGGFQPPSPAESFSQPSNPLPASSGEDQALTRFSGPFNPNPAEPEKQPSINPYTMRQITKDNFQLLGISCLCIASKIDEVYVPSQQDLAITTDNAYNATQIQQMEYVVLGALGWLVHPPTSSVFTRLYLKLLAQYSAEVHEIFVPTSSPATLVDPSTAFGKKPLNAELSRGKSGVDLTAHQATFMEYVASPSLSLQAEAFASGYVIDEHFVDNHRALLSASDLPTVPSLSTLSRQRSSHGSGSGVGSENNLSQQENKEYQAAAVESHSEASTSASSYANEASWSMPQCDQSAFWQPTEVERRLYSVRNKQFIPPPSAFTASHRWYRVMELLDACLLDSEHVFIPASSLACAAIALVYPEARIVCPWIFNRPRLAPALIFVSRFLALPFYGRALPLNPYFETKISTEAEYSRQSYHPESLSYALDSIEGFPRFSFALSEQLVMLWNEGCQHPSR